MVKIKYKGCRECPFCTEENRDKVGIAENLDYIEGVDHYFLKVPKYSCAIGQTDCPVPDSFAESQKRLVNKE